MVLFIHRPEYYHLADDGKGHDVRGKAQIIIAKHRNGGVGDVLLTFKSKYARFQNVDDDIISPEDGGVEHDSKMNEISSSENMGGELPPPASINGSIGEAPY